MIENAPLLSAVAVPKEEEPLNRVTVEPASAVPVIVGVESSVVVAAVVNDVGALGAVVSIINALFAPKEPDAPGDDNVSVASLLAASFIVHHLMRVQRCPCNQDHLMYLLIELYR